MPPFALVLVLTSAAVHGVWNTLLKQHPSPYQATMGVSLWCGASAIGFGLATMHDPFPTAAAWHWALAAGLCETCYFYSLGLAMEKASLAVAYTLSRGGAVVFIWPLTMMMTHEPFAVGTAAGAALVGTGLILTGYQKTEAGSSVGVAAALVAAVFISLNHVAYKMALLSGGQPSMVFALAMVLATGMSVFRVGPRRLQALAREGLFTSPYVVAAGVLATVSFLLMLAALQQVGPGAVLTLRNLSIPFTVLLAWRLGERPRRLQLAGSLLVTLGAVLFSV